jgi:hypothetical protein
MDPEDRCSGVVILVVALAIVGGSLTLRLGGPRNPGPGAYPLLLGVLIALLAAALAVRQHRQGFSLALPRRILHAEGAVAARFLLLLFMYIAALEWLGFALATFVFLGLMSIVVERQGVVISVLYAAAVTGLTYWAFVRALKVNLPRGFLG